MKYPKNLFNALTCDGEFRGVLLKPHLKARDSSQFDETTVDVI